MSKEKYDPYKGFRQLTGLWEKQMNSLLLSMSDNNEYIKLSNVGLQTHTRYLEMLKRNQEIMASFMNMPTKNDVKNVAKLTIQAEEKIDAQIVSFSVDPERDTPETLKEFANKFQADFSNWHFLTGYSEEETKELAKAFKTLAEAEPGTDQFFHSTKIFLINEDGIIVKGYNGLDVPYDETISDLKALTK